MRFFPPAGGDRELDAQGFGPARQDGNSGAGIAMSSKQSKRML